LGFLAKFLKVALKHYLSMTGISLWKKKQGLKCCQPYSWPR